jgi:hypothetical protein
VRPLDRVAAQAGCRCSNAVLARASALTTFGMLGSTIAAAVAALSACRCNGATQCDAEPPSSQPVSRDTGWHRSLAFPHGPLLDSLDWVYNSRDVWVISEVRDRRHHHWFSQWRSIVITPACRRSEQAALIIGPTRMFRRSLSVSVVTVREVHPTPQEFTADFVQLLPERVSSLFDRTHARSWTCRRSHAYGLSGDPGC